MQTTLERIIAKPIAPAPFPNNVREYKNLKLGLYEMGLIKRDVCRQCNGAAKNGAATIGITGQIWDHECANKGNFEWCDK